MQTETGPVVLAGCGDLGTRVGRRLLDAGHEVLALRRNPNRLPDGIPGAAVDLRHARPELPARTAAVVVALAPDARDQQTYRSIFLDGLANLLEAVRGCAHVPRVLFVSSISVYGQDDGGWVDEATPAEPSSPTGAVVREAERLLHAELPDAISLRLAGLYGPGRGRLMRKLRAGELAMPTRPRYTNRIHVDDAAAAVVHLLTAVGDPEPLYLGSDHEPADYERLLRFLAAELAVPVPGPGTDETVGSAGKRCSGDRLRATGFRFAYPSYREGYRSLITGGRGVDSQVP